MAPKRIAVHQRVSGSFGDYIEGPTKRRRRQRLYGQVVSAVGEKKYLVRFDNGLEKECSSNSLRVEKIHESIPPDVIPPQPATIREERELEEQAEDAADQEEEEELAVEADEGNEEEQESEDADAPVEEGETQEAVPDGMPGQLPAGDNLPKDYAAVKKAAKDKIAAMVGKEVTVTSRSMGSISWKVVASVDPVDLIPEKDSSVNYGLQSFDVGHYKKSEVFSSIFLKLIFKDWKSTVVKMNKAVLASKAKTRQFSNSEFLSGLAILIGAAEFAQRGCDLFSVKDSGHEEEVWASLCAEPHFEKIMSFYRWKEFRRFFPAIFVDETRKENDPWYEFSAAIDEFNEIRQSELTCSQWVSLDETMSAWRPRKTALGGLPNISFIARKPEPLGKIKIKKGSKFVKRFSILY